MVVRYWEIRFTLFALMGFLLRFWPKVTPLSLKFEKQILIDLVPGALFAFCIVLNWHCMSIGQLSWAYHSTHWAFCCFVKIFKKLIGFILLQNKIVSRKTGFVVYLLMLFVQMDSNCAFNLSIWKFLRLNKSANSLNKLAIKHFIWKNNKSWKFCLCWYF